MELEFTNIDNIWVAEFEVTNDFNLHIERNAEGRLDIYQRTAGGEYEHIHNTGYLNNKAVYDNDFQALVYPKWIKIKSSVKPLIATITTDGEVNEVVYQAKDIEITSNGTTQVTADTGYTALGSVNVKVNVPTEGGGGSTPTELQRNDVNFFDYDGTLLYAYTWDEAKALTELPALPVHDGLEVREWNYTLDDIKAQGVSSFSDIYGTSYISAEDVIVEGVKYRAFSQTGSLEETSEYTMPVYLLTKEPKVGDFVIGASYYGADEWELWYDGDSLYQSEIIDVFSTIGKADVGACCYDGDGELVMTNGAYIIPRGITRLDDETPYSVPREHMAKVLSIPATLISVSHNALENAYIEHLRMPISVDYETYYNRTFGPVVTKSFWINGHNLDTFIIENIRGLSVVNIPNTFISFSGMYDSFKDAHIIYMPETIQDIEQFDFASKRACVIFNNHKTVPILESSSYSGTAIFVVPDDLYDEWLASTNWANIAYSIKKLSEYNYLIK